MLPIKLSVFKLCFYQGRRGATLTGAGLFPINGLLFMVVRQPLTSRRRRRLAASKACDVALRSGPEHAPTL